MPLRRLFPLAGLAAAAVACGGAPTAGDYADGAEDFITDGLDGQAEAAGVTFSDPACDDPPETSTGTVFTCTATGSDGTVYTFSVTVVGRNDMQLVAEPPLPVATSGSVVTASTPPGT